METPRDKLFSSVGAEQPGAVALHPTADDATTDDDQWEYEYSTTESETYYLTVELSYPEFRALSKPQGLQNTRGGHYKTWLRHANETGQARRHTRDDQTPVDGQRASSVDATRNDQDGSDDADEEPLPAAVADDDNLDIDPSLMHQTYEMEADRREEERRQLEHARQKKNKPIKDKSQQGQADVQPIQDIQILDLHSDRPFISYRGRAFQGEWAEVIGTEMILTDHDDTGRNLPALRNLPRDVDLLAASCCRILTTEKALRLKEPEEDPLADVRKEWLINIPPGVDKSGERAQQASFLEKLIGLKIKKGEKDQVTVYAKEASGKNFKDNRDPSSRTRRRNIDPNQEVDDDGRPIPQKRQPRSSRGRRRAPGKFPRIPHDERLSVPTPNRWADQRAKISKEGKNDDEEMESNDEDMGSFDENDDDDSERDIAHASLETDSSHQNGSDEDEDEDDVEEDDDDEEGDEDAEEINNGATASTANNRLGQS